MVPMNLFVKNKADYINTGVWSKKAIAEAKKLGEVNVVASSESEVFNHIPEIPTEKFNAEADYLYITTNNTIYGTCYDKVPKTGNIPLIADMSSDIMSKRYNINNFELIFAGAQKNMGIAGLTIVIMKDSLLSRSKNKKEIPTMLNYNTHVEAESMFNTPPCYAIYITKLVLDWVENFGGLEALEAHNKEKAAKLYNFIDNSKLYKTTVSDILSRSIMNVPFITQSEELDTLFIKQATQAGLVNLKGHRSVGGMRASIYNGMPMEGVVALIDFMQQFERLNG
jgi:phosphoserine aminotransferase